MKGGEKVKVSANQLQQPIQGENKSKKMDRDSSSMDFQGAMMQMLSMLSTSFQGQEMHEEQGLLQGNMSLQNLTELQEKVMDLISITNLKGLNLQSLNLEMDQDLLLQLKNILTSQGKEISLQQIDEKGIEKIMELIHSQKSSMSNEIPQKMDDHSLDTILAKLGKIQESLKEKDVSFNASKIEGEGQWTKQQLEMSQEKNILLGKMEEAIEAQKGNPSKKQEKTFFTQDVHPQKNKQGMQSGMTQEVSIKENSIENEGIPSKQADHQQVGFQHQSLSFSRGLENIQTISQQVEIQNMQDVVNQMIEKMKVLKEGDQSSLQVQLKPEELGEISVQLKMKDGKMMGEILVENLTTKGAIEGQLQNLKQRLSDQSISLNEVNIYLQQEDQGQGQESGQGFFHQRNHSPRRFLEENSQEEEGDNSQRYFQLSSQKSYYTTGVKSSLNLLA